MARNPVAKHGGEFADLHVNPAILERRVTQQVFVRAPIAVRLDAWIEATIHPRLDQTVKMLAEPSIDEEREPGIENEIVPVKEQTRRRLIDVIPFQIQQPAQVHSQKAIARLDE